MTNDELQLILESSVALVEKRRAIRKRIDVLSPKSDKKELAELNACLVELYFEQFGE